MGHSRGNGEDGGEKTCMFPKIDYGEEAQRTIDRTWATTVAR